MFKGKKEGREVKVEVVEVVEVVKVVVVVEVVEVVEVVVGLEVVEVIKVVEHCARHCTLMMVCGIVLSKGKTTKVGMVWYELNIVNESMNE